MPFVQVLLDDQSRPDHNSIHLVIRSDRHDTLGRVVPPGIHPDGARSTAPAPLHLHPTLALRERRTDLLPDRHLRHVLHHPSRLHLSLLRSDWLPSLQSPRPWRCFHNNVGRSQQIESESSEDVAGRHRVVRLLLAATVRRPTSSALRAATSDREFRVRLADPGHNPGQPVVRVGQQLRQPHHLLYRNN